MSNWICGLEKLKLHFGVMNENDAWAKGAKYFVTLWLNLDNFGTTANGIIRKCIWNCLIWVLLPGECLTQDTESIWCPCSCNMEDLCPVLCDFFHRGFKTFFPTRIRLIPQKRNRLKSVCGTYPGRSITFPRAKTCQEVFGVSMYHICSSIITTQF